MANPKVQAKKIQKETEEREVNPVEEAREQMEGLAVKAEQLTMKPLGEVLGQAERAYAAYTEATREVSRIYRHNEVQVAEAYRKAEQQADLTCEESIKQALKARGQAEQRAREAYERAKEQAEKDSEEAIAEVLKIRDDTTAKAWQLREETLTQAWEIYSKFVR